MSYPNGQTTYWYLNAGSVSGGAYVPFDTVTVQPGTCPSFKGFDWRRYRVRVGVVGFAINFPGSILTAGNTHIRVNAQSNSGKPLFTLRCGLPRHSPTIDQIPTLPISVDLNAATPRNNVAIRFGTNSEWPLGYLNDETDLHASTWTFSFPPGELISGTPVFSANQLYMMLSFTIEPNPTYREI